MRNVERFKYNNIIKQYYKNSLINIHDHDNRVLAWKSVCVKCKSVMYILLYLFRYS
jgi:hypothetical protein